jgi:hypothetical protein
MNDKDWYILKLYLKSIAKEKIQVGFLKGYR